MLSMRITDLKYIVLNTFDDIKRMNFFQCHDILQGKSLCDISLTDPKSILDALNLWKNIPEE